ncbi:MAG TPA: Rieske 2Fe-2S domain-containing protein [Methanomassiliicoccales archaeon]|nr:Rieske 2Fe-2S domain-containing protein [Methanomassiliicoccales archaeon]
MVGCGTVKVRVGSASELNEGGRIQATADGKTLVLVRSEGKLYALDGRCSHMGIPLVRGTVSQGTIRCALHGAIFDLATGKVLSNPQARDLRTYTISQEGDELYVDV